jgi:hypothetical protein
MDTFEKIKHSIVCRKSIRNSARNNIFITKKYTLLDFVSGKIYSVLHHLYFFFRGK